MSGSDRTLSIFFLCALAAIVSLGLIISSCSIKTATISAPLNQFNAKAEHVQRMQCMQLRGNWNDYGKCEFKK